MGCQVTFHDRIGRERLAAAVEPTPVDAALELVESAVAETSRLALGARACEVELSFVADAEMTRLNFDHMGERSPTDVLSFPLADPGDLEDRDRPLFLGEIYISVDTARAQARAARRPYRREVAYLAIHGLLHLLGYDHAGAAARRRMTAVESRLLREAGPML